MELSIRVQFSIITPQYFFQTSPSFNIKYIILTAICALLVFIQIASAEYVSPVYSVGSQISPRCAFHTKLDKEAIQCLERAYSLVYGLKYDILDQVIACESTYNPNAIGDHGLAKNVMQFHKPTFDGYSKKFGEQLDYESANDQIKLGAWMMSQGESYRNNWTCYKKIK